MLSLESNVIPASNKKPYQAPFFTLLGVKGTEVKPVTSTQEDGITTAAVAS